MTTSSIIFASATSCIVAMIQKLALCILVFASLFFTKAKSCHCWACPCNGCLPNLKTRKATQQVWTGSRLWQQPPGTDTFGLCFFLRLGGGGVEYDHHENVTYVVQVLVFQYIQLRKYLFHAGGVVLVFLVLAMSLARQRSATRSRVSCFPSFRLSM